MRFDASGYATAVLDGPSITDRSETTQHPPSLGLYLAIAALRRDLDARAKGSRTNDIAEIERSRPLLAALTALEKIYATNERARALAIRPEGERAGGPLQRVCRYAMMLTALVAPEHATDPQFEYGFLLHDIGTLTVPESVLMNPGAFSDLDWELMMRHPEAGRSLLEDIPFLADACRIVHAHHERWDGKGYPRGLVGTEIPLGARILLLCDAFNAMTQDHPYKKAHSITDARGEVHRGSGRQFWPAAVTAFLSLPDAELEAVRNSSAYDVIY
jgi:HD-GYP domain-containing protein (c-di-GMP phosphodiesterase class II)